MDGDSVETLGGCLDVGDGCVGGKESPAVECDGLGAVVDQTELVVSCEEAVDVDAGGVCVGGGICHRGGEG